MHQRAFKKELLAMENVPKDRRSDIKNIAKGMDDKRRQQFFEELKEVHSEDLLNMESEVEVLDQMEELVSSGEHAVRNTENREQSLAEEQERREGLQGIESLIDATED